MEEDRTYTIQETAKLCGLPESTLRYYETIGIIQSIKRDPSSGHRVYSEDDINYVVSVACLNATGMSIDDMRAYLGNRGMGAAAAGEQIKLLEAQKQRLEDESRFLGLRQKYVDIKIDYWKADSEGNAKKIEEVKGRANKVARELKLPKDQSKRKD